MSKNLPEDFDKALHDAIENLEEAPDHHVWENIDKELDKQDIEKFKRKYLYYRAIAFLLFFLFLSVITFDLIENQSNQNYKAPVSKNNAFSKKEATHFKNIITDKSAFTTSQKDVSFTKHSIPFSTNPDKKDEPKNNELNTSIVHNINIAGAVSLSFIDNKKLIIVSAKESFLLAEQPDKDDVKRNMKHPSQQRTDDVGTFSISAFAAPEYANYILENDEVSNSGNKSIIEQRENHLLSFSSGLLVNYNVSKNIAIQSGLSFSSSSINIDPNKIYAERDNSGNVKYRYNTSSGYGYILPSFNIFPVVGDSLYALSTVHRLEFLSVPLTVHYKFYKKKLLFNPGIGAAINFLTKGSLETEVLSNANTEKEAISKLNGLKKVNFSILLTSEIQYQLTEKISLAVTPYFKCALSSINRNSVVKTYPYDIGLAAGIVFRL